jgi:putative transposase
MPNHVHLVLAPSDPAGLALALSRAHRLYAGYFNARARQTGHLFQGRFGSLAMDEDHLIAAVRYVALNPVRARLVATASEWPHSSVRAHMAGVDDALVSVQPLRDRVANFADLLDTDPDDPEFNALRRNEVRGAKGRAGAMEPRARNGRACWQLCVNFNFWGRDQPAAQRVLTSAGKLGTSIALGTLSLAPR